MFFDNSKKYYRNLHTSLDKVKYYNKYITNDVNTACNEGRCLSQGLSETVGWYNDARTFTNENSSWLMRGGLFGDTDLILDAGIFNFYPSTRLGNGSLSFSFRLVATIR